MSNIKNHAESELNLLCKISGTDIEDRPLVEEFIPEMLLLIDKFGNSGQSGGSAPYTANAICNTLRKLMLFEPISPISGIDEEWMEVSNEVYQNKRCGSIFKQSINGTPYYLDAIVWQGEDDWDSFTGTVCGISSRQYIKKFPFKPKTFRINLRRELYDTNNPKHINGEVISCGPGDMIYFLKDKNELNEVWEYYDKYNNLKNG
jgi:hypothetical protein